MLIQHRREGEKERERKAEVHDRSTERAKSDRETETERRRGTKSARNAGVVRSALGALSTRNTRKTTTHEQRESPDMQYAIGQSQVFDLLTLLEPEFYVLCFKIN